MASELAPSQGGWTLIKWLLLLLLTSLLSALEIEVQGGKEEQQTFSIIHLKDTLPFLCEDHRNDLDQTREIICIFERRPTESFRPLSNDFFTITSQKRQKDYLLSITPHHHMRLFPIVFDLTRDTETFRADVQQSRHWMIAGYRDKLPFIDERPMPVMGINFPITMEKEVMPFVGSLDLKGDPVRMTQLKDVRDYITIKRFFKAGDYEKALELSQNAIETYPDTVFMSELMLYKIRSHYHLEQDEELLEVAKKFLRTYASDENVPEVLAYTADAYSGMGLYIDADYFFDRLFTEHDDDRFARLGMIFKAKQLEESGNSKKALTYYERALHETKDPMIAAKAAFNLTEHYLDHGEVDQATDYAQKILDGASDYFVENKAESLEMAMTFADRGKSSIAADIEGVIMNSMLKSDPRYEVLQKNQGIWLAQADRKEEAIAVLDDYLKRYKFGNFRDEVIRVKDSLFFDDTDDNLSAKITKYDGLVEQYGMDEIGRKALYKKAKMLYDAGRYVEVLDIKDQLKLLDPALYPDGSELVQDSAVGLMQQALEKEACTDVIALSQEFEVKLTAKWDAGVYGCAMKGGDYELARSLAKPYLKSKQIDERMDWLERYAKAAFSLGEYKDVVDASKELISLRESEGGKGFEDAFRLQFDANARQGDEEGMVLSIKALEENVGLQYKDVERYSQMVSLAQKSKDNAMIETYATKVIALQDRTNSHTQSPYIEFTLVQAYIIDEKTKEALQTLKTLDSRDLNDEHRSRQKYLEGTLLQRTAGPKASQAAFEAAVKAAPDSAWGKLAKDALELL